ncbi:hypothetical protein GIB67_035379 [Kingdonia uniflora]|uniref:J domain-containing protein n=1 Tax=Kingdonia uniflora TaxID=39325 RepID=A0A7J7MMN0_9MAGN|nr:hypothetical protein GIB67_035379 [Kingdonia uniflora]
MGDTEDDLLLKNFFAEVSEVERENEVLRILSCFKLNAFEYLNLPFHSSPDDVKKQYRKLSLMVHPDKCKHPQAKEAFGDLGLIRPYYEGRKGFAAFAQTSDT